MWGEGDVGVSVLRQMSERTDDMEVEGVRT